MITSADEARRRAQQGTAAQRLVNELAVQPLTEASARGESSAKVSLEAVTLPGASALRGRIGDLSLIEALEKDGQALLGTALRKFGALGFRVSSYLEVENARDAHAPGRKPSGARFDHVVLDYGAAAEAAGRAALLDGVTLAPAFHWRQRAESAGMVQRMETTALALISSAAARGGLECRVGWRDLSGASINAAQLGRVAEALRGRGFQTAPVDAGTGLLIRWS